MKVFPRRHAQSVCLYWQTDSKQFKLLKLPANEKYFNAAFFGQSRGIFYLTDKKTALSDEFNILMLSADREGHFPCGAQLSFQFLQLPCGSFPRPRIFPPQIFGGKKLPVAQEPARAAYSRRFAVQAQWPLQPDHKCLNLYCRCPGVLSAGL